VALGLAMPTVGNWQLPVTSCQLVTGSLTAVAMGSLLAKLGWLAMASRREFVCPFGRGQLKRQVSDERYWATTRL